jgi:hypothetical protein
MANPAHTRRATAQEAVEFNQMRWQSKNWQRLHELSLEFVRTGSFKCKEDQQAHSEVTKAWHAELMTSKFRFGAHGLQVVKERNERVVRPKRTAGRAFYSHCELCTRPLVGAERKSPACADCSP